MFYPILDHTGKPYTEVTNWTLQDIDALPANATKLRETQVPKHKHLISVPTDTGKITKTTKSSTSQTVKDTSTPQPVTSITYTCKSYTKRYWSLRYTTTISTYSTSKYTHYITSYITFQNAFIRDRAVFFPQTTFDGKDKTKTRTHLQSFEDFVDRQSLTQKKSLKKSRNIFNDTSRFG